MRKLLLLLPIAITLASCGEDLKIKDMIRDNLRDPGSAQFRDFILSADGKRACIVWNAKNSMGGYGDWSIAELNKENSKWVIKEMEGNMDNCSEINFKAFDAGEKAELDARINSIQILKNAKKISIEAASKMAVFGECKHIVLKYVYLSKKIAEYRVNQNLVALGRDQVIFNKIQEKLNNGNCDDENKSDFNDKYPATWGRY